jgi:hypothetical protein
MSPRAGRGGRRAAGQKGEDGSHQDRRHQDREGKHAARPCGRRSGRLLGGQWALISCTVAWIGAGDTASGPE